MSMSNIKSVGRAVLSGTSTFLDVAYELSGRRMGALHKGAEILYDLSRTGEDFEATPAWNDPAPAAPAPEPAVVAEPEPEVAPAEAAEAAPAEEAPVEEAAVEAAPEATEAAADASADSAFPIEDYDSLNVRAVKFRLESLDADALAVVRDYEAANKNRKTVAADIKKRLAELAD